MSGITVTSLGGRCYRVSDNGTVLAVVWGKAPTCECASPDKRCAHLVAVEAFRQADPQAALLYPMAPEAVLDLLGPSWKDVKQQRERMPLASDAYQRAVAICALEAWSEELRARTRTPLTFDGLWAAACCVVEGLETERTAPSQAAESFALAAQIIEREAAA
jgi:hypothetical protein